MTFHTRLRKLEDAITLLQRRHTLRLAQEQAEAERILRALPYVLSYPECGFEGTAARLMQDGHPDPRAQANIVQNVRYNTDRLLRDLRSSGLSLDAFLVRCQSDRVLPPGGRSAWRRLLKAILDPPPKGQAAGARQVAPEDNAFPPLTASATPLPPRADPVQNCISPEDFPAVGPIANDCNHSSDAPQEQHCTSDPNHSPSPRDAPRVSPRAFAFRGCTAPGPALWRPPGRDLFG